MRRRSGQSGQVVRKGKTWHVRFDVYVPGQRKRQRKSVPIGPAVGKEKFTKPEAARKAAEIIRYVRRSVWNGQELAPKTENAVREINIDPALFALLRDYIGSSRRIRLFESLNGSPLSAGNIRNHVLHPLRVPAYSRDVVAHERHAGRFAESGAPCPSTSRGAGRTRNRSRRATC